MLDHYLVFCFHAGGAGAPHGGGGRLFLALQEAAGSGPAHDYVTLCGPAGVRVLTEEGPPRRGDPDRASARAGLQDLLHLHQGAGGHPGKNTHKSQVPHAHTYTATAAR